LSTAEREMACDAENNELAVVFNSTIELKSIGEF
jgi:hypothetical protein